MDTLNSYLSIVFFYDLLADRKTKPCAGAFCRKKWFKEVYLIFLPDPGTCVRYLDDKSIPVDNIFTLENIYRNLSTVRHSLHAVYKQIQQHLFQLKVVSTDQREAFSKSLFIETKGFLISWASPAATVPRDASFSAVSFCTMISS